MRRHCAYLPVVVAEWSELCTGTVLCAYLPVVVAEWSELCAGTVHIYLWLWLNGVSCVQALCVSTCGRG